LIVVHAPLETARLILRRWRDSDHAPFAELNSDPEVMRHFPSTVDRTGSDGMITRIEKGFAFLGYGLYAIEVNGGSPFIGYVGLVPVRAPNPLAPAVEIGWRLARRAWGHGYASEAARACLALAFDRLGLDEVVSFTAVANAPSRAVMERIGLRADPDRDFDHPALDVGHPLRRHVLYAITRNGFADLTRGAS
jgi:ribosomal-protein-alanine N-acetyltransferase